jgi:murein L,D-transpeptidase YcbB/YkuD
MRAFGFDRLLAGTMLALVVAAPDNAAAASEAIEAVMSATAAHANANTAATDIKGTLKQPVPIDAQIAERLREIVGAKAFERRIDSELERQAIAGFYAERGYAALWISDGRPNARAEATIARLKNADADGLEAQDFLVPQFGAIADAELLADADIELTTSVLAFARQLAVGRLAPTRVLGEVDYGNHAPAPADSLRKIAEARDENAALESFNPPHAAFMALKAKLAALRAAKVADIAIPDGRVLKPRMKDARAALNAPKPGKPIETVLANMERWRWLPRDLGRNYVMVNIPDYALKLVHDDQAVWRTKIVAGKPQTPTPLLSASMDNIIVNPSWHVPQSIIQNELLPRYGRDPNIFARMGLEVKRRPDGSLSVVQPPGVSNALGRIKFNFPNNFQVYLHDTPQKRLFNDDRRAFSHGCMRVQDPTRFAELILQLTLNGRAPNERQINSLFGRGERVFKLDQRPSVHLTYQTAFVDEAGRLQLRDDIYGIDGRIQALWHSDKRLISGLAPKNSERGLAMLQRNKEVLGQLERGEASSPALYFERLMR